MEASGRLALSSSKIAVQLNRGQEPSPLLWDFENNICPGSDIRSTVRSPTTCRTNCHMIAGEVKGQRAVENGLKLILSCDIRTVYLPLD